MVTTDAPLPTLIVDDPGLRYGRVGGQRSVEGRKGDVDIDEEMEGEAGRPCTRLKYAYLSSFCYTTRQIRKSANIAKGS